jgi:hypothetical protein
MGHAVAQFVEAQRFKPEGRGFDSRWCHWNFSMTISFRPHYGPGVDSVSNRNEHQECFLLSKGGRCVRLCRLSWEPEPSGTLRACPGIVLFYQQLRSVVTSRNLCGFLGLMTAVYMAIPKVRRKILPPSSAPTRYQIIICFQSFVFRTRRRRGLTS